MDAAVTMTTTATFWSDPTRPASGESFFYIARPVAPFIGSWGSGTAAGRGVNVLIEGDMEAWTSPTDLATAVEIVDGGAVEQEVDPAVVFEQDCAARLTRSGDGALDIQKTHLGLRPGFDHVLSFAARFDRTFSNAMQVRIFNNTTGEDLQLDGSWAVGATYFNFNVTPTYQVFTLPFTVDAGFSPSDDVRLVLRHRGATPVGSILWVDDARILER